MASVIFNARDCKLYTVAFSLQVTNLSNQTAHSGSNAQTPQTQASLFARVNGFPCIFMDFRGCPFHGDCCISSCWIPVLTCTHRSRSLSPNIPVLHKTLLCQTVKIPGAATIPRDSCMYLKAWIRAVQCFLGSTQIYQDILWQDLQTDGVIGDKMATSRHMHRCFHKLGSKPWVSLAPPVQSSDQQGSCRLPCTRQVYSKLLLRAKVWFFSVSSSSSSSTSSVCRGIHIHIHSFANDRKVKLYYTAGVWDFKTMDWRLQFARIKISERPLVAGSKSKHIRICWSFGLLQAHLTSGVRQAGILAIVTSLAFVELNITK